MNANILISSISLIEKDVNGDIFYVWHYPAELSTSIQKITLNKINLADNTSNKLHFIYYKFKSEWIYALSVYDFHDESLNKSNNESTIIAASLIISTKASFHPEKYYDLLHLFMKQYQISSPSSSSSSFDPTKIVEAYLQILCLGCFSSSGNTTITNNNTSSLSSFSGFRIKDYDNGYNLNKASSTVLKELYESLGIEFIVIWNALLLKKRILVFADTTERILTVIQSLSLLIWHRKDFSILRPLIHSSDEELISELKTLNTFLSGTTDPFLMTLLTNNTSYDVLLSYTDNNKIIEKSDSSSSSNSISVDRNNMERIESPIATVATVTVMAHAQQELKMCQIHREIDHIVCQEIMAINNVSISSTTVHSMTPSAAAALRVTAAAAAGGGVSSAAAGVAVDLRLIEAISKKAIEWIDLLKSIPFKTTSSNNNTSCDNNSSSGINNDNNNNDNHIASTTLMISPSTPMTVTEVAAWNEGLILDSITEERGRERGGGDKGKNGTTRQAVAKWLLKLAAAEGLV